MPCVPAYDLVASRLEDEKLTEYFIEVSDEDQRNDLCDDTSFKIALNKIRKIISSKTMRRAIMMHPGMEVPEPDAATKRTSGSD